MDCGMSDLSSLNISAEATYLRRASPPYIQLAWPDPSPCVTLHFSRLALPPQRCHVISSLASGEARAPATAAGYRDLLGWARASGTVRRAGVEGTGSFGAALSRYLLAQGVGVLGW
jgi:hypothetical protein